MLLNTTEGESMRGKALAIENATFIEIGTPVPLGFGPLFMALKLTGEAGQ
jgi:hypothetical protein